MIKSFECPNCNRSFNRKAHLEQHLTKKNPCMQKNEEIQNNPIKIQNHPFEIQNNNLILKDDYTDENLQNPNLDPDITCQYCLKSFYQTSNLNKHLKYNCKVKKQQDEEKEEIFKQLLLKDSIIKEKEEQINKKDEQINKILEQNQQLITQIEKLTKLGLNNKSNKSSKSVQMAKTITNTTNTANSNNTTNNTSNIVLFNFGKENLDIIDKKQYINRVIKNNITGVKIPEEILKLIHFNPAYPQLSNIYISDINREKCMVYDDGMWKLSPTDKIPEVIDRVVEYSYNRDEELREIFKNNKPVIDRLNVINKYVKMNDNEYLELLKEQDLDDDNISLGDDQANNQNLEQIKRCENFQKKTYNTFKTTLYNEGKKLKK
jgi:hypothetical protein